MNLSAGETRGNSSCLGKRTRTPELRLPRQTSSRLQQDLSKNILPPNAHYFKEEKEKLGEVGEINQAYSGRDNKFAAYIEDGNPICLVPHFHGKAIPFSCFQRPPKSAMISSFRSNLFKIGNVEKLSSVAKECRALQPWKTHLRVSFGVYLATCSIYLVNIAVTVNTCTRCSVLLATAELRPIREAAAVAVPRVRRQRGIRTNHVTMKAE